MTPPSRRRKQGGPDEPGGRERLLDAAIGLFARRGFAATSVGAICARAGVGRPALYWHFDSKEGLLEAVLEALAARWIDEVRKQTAVAADPDARLRGLLAEMRRLVVEDPALLLLPTLAALEQGRDSARVRAAVLRIWDRNADALLRGVRASLGVSLPDPEPVGHAFVTGVQAAAVRFSIDRDEARLDANLRELERTLRALIGLRLRDRARRAW